MTGRQFCGRSADGTSINSWIQDAIEREASRRRCVAHGQWMDANPDVRDELPAQAEAAALKVDDLRRDGAGQ